MAEHALRHEGGPPEEGEWQQDEPRQCDQFEFEDRNENLHRENEEGEHDDHPGDEQNHDLDEVGEEPDRADEIGGRIEKRLRGVKAGRCDHSRPHEVADRHRAAARLQAKTCEAFQENGRKRLKIADYEGENTDIKRLLYEPLQHVLVSAPGPEQGRDRDVDHDQRR